MKHRERRAVRRQARPSIRERIHRVHHVGNPGKRRAPLQLPPQRALSHPRSAQRAGLSGRQNMAVARSSAIASTCAENWCSGALGRGCRAQTRQKLLKARRLFRYGSLTRTPSALGLTCGFAATRGMERRHATTVRPVFSVNVSGVDCQPPVGTVLTSTRPRWTWRRDSEWFHVKHRESCAGERERLGLSIPWFRVSPRRPRAQSLSGKTCDAIRPVPTLGTALSAATRGLQQSMAPMVDDQQRMEPRFGTDSSGLAS